MKQIRYKQFIEVEAVVKKSLRECILGTISSKSILQSMVLTRVRVRDWGFSIRSIFTLVMAIPFSNMSARACSTFSRRSSLSFRTSMRRILVSVFEPIKEIFDLRSKHRGHGQRARYRKHDINILVSEWVQVLLFRVLRELTSQDNRLSMSWNVERRAALLCQSTGRDIHVHKRAWNRRPAVASRQPVQALDEGAWGQPLSPAFQNAPYKILEFYHWSRIEC